MLARLGLCVSTVVALAAALPAQVSVAWSDTYDGAAIPQQKTEVDAVAAVPGGGVVCACHVSEWMPGTPPFWLARAIDVVRWDAAGQKVWSTRVPAGNNMIPKSIVVGAQGIVYVGANLGNYTHNLFALNPAGALVWNRVSPGGEGLVKLIAAPGGGVYVAGYDQASDMAMRVMYWTQAGVQQWATSIQGPLGGIDFPSGIVLDPAGKIVIAGRFCHPTTSEIHLGLAKLSPSGQLLWSRSQSGGRSTGWCVTTAPNGDILAGGEIEPVANLWSSSLVARYDTNGTPLWSQLFHHPETGSNSVEHIAVAADGSVWGTGGIYFNNRYYINVVHYSPSGTPLLRYWHKPPGDQFMAPSGLILGSAGQVWVGGSGTERVTPQILNGYATLLQFDSTSALNWHREFDLSVASGNEYFGRGFVLAEGNQLVLGGMTGTYQADDALMLAIDIRDLPRDYCVAKTNSQGCMPAMTSAGVASASATSGFVVTARNELNQRAGLLLYSLAGEASLPFQGGTLCLAVPVRRTPGGSAGGSSLPALDCSGSYGLDMNAFAAGAAGSNPDPALAVTGATVCMQAWGRDPGLASPNSTSLSNGLRYVVGP